MQQVEVNTIASSFAALAVVVGHIHRYANAVFKTSHFKMFIYF